MSSWGALDQPQARRAGEHPRRSSSRAVRGDDSFKAFLGDTEDLVRNIHGVATVAELDGDEVGYLVAKVAEIKRQR